MYPLAVPRDYKATLYLTELSPTYRSNRSEHEMLSQLEKELEGTEILILGDIVPVLRSSPILYSDVGLPVSDFKISCKGASLKKRNKAKMRWSSKKANHGTKPCHGKK